MATVTTGVPYGYCHCGCGEKAPLAPQTHAAKGWVKGEPCRYLPTHHLRSKAPEYVEEDRGYETPCWVWQRALDPNGYGRLNRPGTHLAHRWFWERQNGPVPEGLPLDHLCRNRACVNPDHLEPVTQAENMRRSPFTCLSADDVREIRASSDDPLTLAQRFGVARRTIYNVLHRVSWADL